MKRVRIKFFPSTQSRTIEQKERNRVTWYISACNLACTLNGNSCPREIVARMRLYTFSGILAHALMIFPYVNFRFSARTVWHFLYVRGRECVRPRSTTTDHLSPTALVHTAPPRHSRPVTANRPPSQPPSSPPQPPYALRLKNYEKHARETRLEDVCTHTFIYEYLIVPFSSPWFLLIRYHVGIIDDLLAFGIPCWLIYYFRSVRSRWFAKELCRERKKS